MKKFAASVAILAALGGVAALAQPPAPPAAPAAAPAAPPASPDRLARQAVMRSNRETQAAINEIVIGIMDPAAIRKHVQTLVDNGAKIATAFGPNTDKNDQGAKPEIWTNAAAFKAANDKFIADVKKVPAAAPDRYLLATAMKDVSDDCTACHTAFRVGPAVPEGRGRGRGGNAAAAAQAAPAQAAPAAANN